MRIAGRLGFVVALTVLVGACATTVRSPLTDVPPGEYMLVEPESDVYNVVAINDRAFTLRMDDMVSTGQHWIDGQGRVHMAFDEGPCAGVPSIWTYSYSNGRVTLDLVEDMCEVRPDPLPDRMVYERM